MSPVPRPRPRDAATANDDFEWPPTANEMSIYELGPDPWQTVQDASRAAFAARRRERPQPQQRAPEAALRPTGKRWRVLIASAIVGAAAGWGAYAAMTPPMPVQAFHHPAPAAAVPPARPPRIKIVATYPVEPDLRSEAATDRKPAVGDAAAASQPGDSAKVPSIAIESTPVVDPALTGAATPVDAPTGSEKPPASGTAAPAGDPSAVAPGANIPDGAGAVRDLPSIR